MAQVIYHGGLGGGRWRVRLIVGKISKTVVFGGVFPVLFFVYYNVSCIGVTCFRFLSFFLSPSMSLFVNWMRVRTRVAENLLNRSGALTSSITFAYHHSYGIAGYW